MREVLRIEDLTVYYYTLRGVVRAVERVYLEAGRGELVAIVGESGCGKSTLGYSILKLVPPPGRILSGRVEVDSVDILELEGDKLRHARGELVSMIFQDPFTTLDPVRRVEEQIVEVLLEHGISKEEAIDRVYDLLRSVGLSERLARMYPHQLSGGQRQRVSIAAAIALEPRVLVADEPTTALDVVVQKQIMDLLDSIRREKGMAVILITHDIVLAAERADKIAIMYAGKIVEEGPIDEVLKEPRHPYTKALLASVIDIESREWPQAITGQPPDLRKPPPGCRFAPRCRYVFDKCRREEPELVEVDHGRRIACWLEERRL